MKRTLLILTALAAVLSGTAVAAAHLGQTIQTVAPIPIPDTHSWLYSGQVTHTGVTIPASFTVPPGECLRVEHIDYDAEKSGGTLPDGGEFSVNFAVVLPSGDQTGGGTELGGASTPSDTRLSWPSYDFSNTILPPGTVVRLIVFVGYNYQPPLTNYYYFATLLGEYVSCD